MNTKRLTKIFFSKKYHFIRFFITFCAIATLFLKSCNFTSIFEFLQDFILFIGLGLISAFIHYGLIEVFIEEHFIEKDGIEYIINDLKIDDYKKKLIIFILQTSIKVTNEPVDIQKREYFVRVYDKKSAEETFSQIINYVQKIKETFL